MSSKKKSNAAEVDALIAGARAKRNLQEIARVRAVDAVDEIAGRLEVAQILIAEMQDSNRLSERGREWIDDVIADIIEQCRACAAEAADGDDLASREDMGPEVSTAALAN